MQELVLDSLLPNWLNAGLNYNDFWTYDIGEIKMMLTFWLNNRKQDMKDQISYMYLSAQMVAQFVGCSLAGKKPPAIEDLFPDLFEHTPVDRTAAVLENFKAYAEMFNEQRASQTADGIYIEDLPEEDTE